METESTKNEIFTDFSSIYEEFEKYIHNFRAFQILNFINIISELTIILISITLCFNENRSLEVMILLLSVTTLSSFLFFKTIKTQTILNGDFKITVCTFDSAAKVLTDWCYDVHVDLSYFSLIKLILELKNDHFYQFRVNNVFIKLIICDMLIFLLNVICLTSGYFFLNYSYYAEAQVLLLITLSLLVPSYFFVNDRRKKYDNKNTFLRKKIDSLMQKLSKEFTDKNKHIPTNEQSDNQNNSISSDYEENNELINILNNSERPVIETIEPIIERNNSDDSTTEKPDKTCMENEQNNIDDGNSPHNDAEVQSIDQSAISNINNYHSSNNEIENATLVSENSHSNGKEILQNSMNNFYLHVDHEGNSVEEQDDVSYTDNTNELDNEKNNNYESTIKKYDNVCIEKKQRDVEEGKSVENTQYSDTAAQNADKSATLTINHSHNFYNGSKNTTTTSENRYSVNIEKETLQESMTESYVSVDYEDNIGEEQADVSYTDNNNSQLNYAKGFVAENTKPENQRSILNEETAENPDSTKHKNNKSDNENNKLLIKIPPDDSYIRSVEQNTVLDDIHCQNSYNENEYTALICRNSYGDEQRILKETHEDEFSVDGEGDSLEGQSDESAEEITNKISLSQKYNECTITSKLKENGETVSAFNDNEISISANGKLANETNTCKENMIKETNSVTENNTFNVENNDEEYILKEPNTGSDSQSTEQNTEFSYNNGQHSNHENENIASSNESSFGSEQNTLQEVLGNNLFLNAEDNTVEERSDRNSANEEIFQQKFDECSLHIKLKETEEATLQFNNNKRYGSENADLENVKNTDSENDIQEPGFINFENYKRKADDNESVARVSHSDSISQIFKQSATLDDFQCQHTNDGNKCSASTSENNYSYKSKISVDHGKEIEVTLEAVSALTQSEKDTHDHCLNTDSNSVDYQEDIKSGNDVRNRDINRCNKEEVKSEVVIECSDPDYYSTDPSQSTAKSKGYDKTTIISNNENNLFDNFCSNSNQKDWPNSFPVISNGQLEDADKRKVKYKISEKKDSENVTKNECDGIQQSLIAPISNTENINESKISKLDSVVATGIHFQNEMHFSEHTLSQSTKTENNASHINHHYMTDGVRKKDQCYIRERMPDVTKNECDGIQQSLIAPISNTENINESKISKLNSVVATGNHFQNEMHFSEHTLSQSTETENNASHINHHYMTDGVRKKDQYYIHERMPDVDTSCGFRDKKIKKHKNKFSRKGKKREIYPSETTSKIAPRTFEGNKESTKRDFLTKNSGFSLENRAAEETSRKGVITLSQNKFKVEIHAYDDISVDYQSSFTTTTEGNLKEAHQFRLRKLKEKRLFT